ncbi:MULTISPECIES: hypothetical protein [Halomonas]|uniref:Uncharacterized protein n=1 Tax=Halomonas flagellata TaxID=2920385 RepID=A0ABS9RQ07_9GAMM|nr:MULTISPECIES: hypothetical protein [Halomonas]MCH4561927.1 hypothetical protein [Halomonas flagellata]PXX98170.1 hypothetical protein CR157_07500 [Halomonas sp. LBP4]
MRVEVEIGTIEVDALPEGVTVEALRTSIVAELTAQIRASGVPKVGDSGRAPPRGENYGASDAPGVEIARRIYGELGR